MFCPVKIVDKNNSIRLCFGCFWVFCSVQLSQQLQASGPVVHTQAGGYSRIQEENVKMTCIYLMEKRSDVDFSVCQNKQWRKFQAKQEKQQQQEFQITGASAAGTRNAETLPCRMQVIWMPAKEPLIPLDFLYFICVLKFVNLLINQN